MLRETAVAARLTLETVEFLCDIRTDELLPRRFVKVFIDDVVSSPQLPILSWFIDIVNEVERRWSEKNPVISRANSGSISRWPYLLSTWLRIWTKHSSKSSWSGCTASLTRERWTTNPASRSGICWAISSRSSRIWSSSSRCSALYLNKDNRPINDE